MKLKTVGRSVDGEPAQLLEKFCGMYPAGQRHLGNKSLILEEHRSRWITSQQTKKEIRSAMLSSIVQVTTGAQAKRRLAMQRGILTGLTVWALFLCYLIMPYWENQQGVCMHFICCESLESLQSDLWAGFSAASFAMLSPACDSAEPNVGRVTLR